MTNCITSGRCRIAWLAALALLTPGAMADDAEYTFDVDVNQSNVAVSVSALGYSDGDNSDVDGTMTATLTPPNGVFDQIHITALSLDLVDSLTLELGPGGLLGGVDITSDNLGLRMGGGFGAAGPAVGVQPSGVFIQTGNFVQGVGTLNYDGYGLLGGPVGSGSVDLATQDSFEVELLGDVVDDGTTTTLTIDVDFAGSYDLNGVVVDIAIFGTVVGTAPTQAGPSLGDMNCDGVISAADIDPFVLALTGGEAAYYAQFPNCDFLNADCNADGTVSAADIDPFVQLLTSN
jgi:hypothetical protein